MFLPLERLYLELRYLSKGMSEFDENDIFEKGKCNVTLRLCKISPPSSPFLIFQRAVRIVLL